MQQPVTEIDYEELTRRLSVSELNPSAAEAHGILCAMICAGQPRAEETWIGELLEGADDADLLARECRSSLQQLAVRTRAEIQGPELGLTLLLPRDSVPLAERAFAIYDWSRGFLYGLGVAGVDVRKLSDQAREACDDFAAITCLDLDDLEECEDNERALMELTEFSWVAAMLIYEERGRPSETER
jgi:uncharacterized protein YgfB (UPF0149 family)